MIHYHPKSDVQRDMVEGERLKPGDILRVYDVYASTNGKWVPCPCPGVLLEKSDVIWVRPSAPKEPAQ